MATLTDRLRELPFFSSLDSDTVSAIVECGQWYSLAGGWELFTQGSPSHMLYFVISGRLIVVREGPTSEEVVGYIRPGEPVGEMSLLAGENHSASVYALRDTEILALPYASIAHLLDAEPDFAKTLALAILRRARHPSASFHQSSPRVFALISTSPSIDIDAKAKTICREIARYGMRAKCFVEASHDGPVESFDAHEVANDIIVLAARISDTPWYRFVLRHADRFFVLARRDARAPRPFPLSPDENSPARRFRLVDLMMIHEGLVSSTVREWADTVGANRIFHWRSEASVGRIARIICGKSIGLVLSGGGARAYAHIGAVRAFREAGLPIDFLCGASMGAIVGACVAMGWNDDEIEMRVRDAFVSSNPLGDHVLPVVALTRGARVETRLQKHFDDALIEELDTPFFCVSSDLVEGVSRIHKLGLLRDALRASISLPGILPPVVEDGALLVDGAVIDNFPTDLMTSVHRGMTIGIDVAQRGTITAEDFKDPPGFFTWVRQHGLSSPPPIVTLLMRAATARPEPAAAAHPADIMITPEIPGVELRDWKKYDDAVAAGYEAAKQAIAANWSNLSSIAAATKSS
ncbi:MAG: patatin-like phospholipase family protein [Parvularculaceae bacterium]